MFDCKRIIIFYFFPLLNYAQEMDRQVPLMDEIDTKVKKVINSIFLFYVEINNLKKINIARCFCAWLIIQVDRATSDVRNTNLRLKKTLTEVTDTR